MIHGIHSHDYFDSYISLCYATITQKFNIRARGTMVDDCEGLLRAEKGIEYCLLLLVKEQVFATRGRGQYEGECKESLSD
jgi:hypothetical protein